MCMARLVRATFGKTAVAERKMEWGKALVILGVSLAPALDHFTCELSPERAEKYKATIVQALETGTLHAGCASKLAGRLSWASLFLFRRMGRAMLRPIFRQASSGCVALRFYRP